MGYVILNLLDLMVVDIIELTLSSRLIVCLPGLFVGMTCHSYTLRERIHGFDCIFLLSLPLKSHTFNWEVTTVSLVVV